MWVYVQYATWFILRPAACRLALVLVPVAGCRALALTGACGLCFACCMLDFGHLPFAICNLAICHVPQLGALCFMPVPYA
jgi:hypothetical protein